MGSPDQPRDWHGRWANGGGGAVSMGPSASRGGTSQWEQAVQRRDNRLAAAMGDRSKTAWAKREFLKEALPKNVRGGSAQYKADLAAARAMLGKK